MSLKFNAARIIACLSTFTFGGAQSIMIALYPAIALALGIDLTAVIYCVSIGTFLFLFGSPYWSNTGNYLSRSSVLLIGTTGLCASFTIVAFLIFNPLSYSLVIILLLISQMIYGLVASATVPAAQALQMQIAEKNTAVNVAFIHTMSLNLGRVLGYSLIVLFYQRFQNVILAYSILIVSVLLILFLFHKKKVLSSPNLQKIKSAWRKEAFDIRWIIAMAMLYTCYLETLIISLAGTIKQQFNLDTLLASGFSAKILLILSIGVFLGQYIGRKLIKESWRMGMLIGILALFSGSISLIHASSLTGLWLSIANIVIGLGLIPPLYLSLLHTETASQNYSKRAGIIAAAHTLGYTTGGFLAGYTFTTPYLHIGYYLATLSLGLGFACARQIFATDQIIVKGMTMNQKLNQLADLHSVTCLLNSLLREYEEYTIYRYLDETHVLISLSKDELIQIPLSRFSILGRHQYTGKFYLKTSHGITPINFETLLDHLCEKLTNVLNIPDEKITHFKQDVLSSRQNIRDALEIQDLSYDLSTDFITAEQALIIGHNFHPTPKSRDVLTTSELKNYAPEFKGNFYLDWILVDAKIIQQTNADSFENCQWLTNLFLEEFPGSIDEIQEGMLPVPMHPWQWQFLQKSPVIIEYLHTKQIIYFKPSVQKWYATSSLRTIYRDRCSYMLKFSISIRLTNSLRILIGSEVKRGLLLHDVLNSRPGQEFQQAFPNFHIITEPASVCLLDTHGEPMENTMIICRENPFQGDNAQNQFMLATLVQDNPFGGDNLILTLLKNNCSNIDIPLDQKLKKWFAAYLLIAIKPFITAYAKYGIIMEGHQQNMVLKLEDAYPVAAYFRDCQDHAYSEYGYNLFGDTVPSVKENPSCVADRLIGCEYFIYQVILNSTFNVITTLAQGNHISEKELLADLHHFLQEIAKDGLNDHFCLDKLLNNAFLLHKCNVRFALQRFNDNQLDFNPLDLYKPVPNLIRASQYPIAKEYYKKILYQRYFESIQKTITLRIAHSEFDLEKFIVWQKNPRVAKYWQLEESEEAEIYFKKMADEPYHQAIIIEINHELAGYGEIYWAAKDPVAEHYAYDNHDRGFHLLIGEDHLLGVNSTTCIFMAIMHYLYLDDAATKRIVIEPDVRNYQFIKYMKIIPGWHFQKEVDFPEKRAALFLSQREYFQLEGV